MRISDVLAGKSSRVVSVWTTKVLRDALKLLDENRIASLVVTSFEGRPLGLLTDRELLSTLARYGERAFDFGIVDIMLQPPPTCSPSTSVHQALRMMTDRRLRHLVVMDGDRMVGLVSIGDLVKIRLEDAETESKVLREMALGQLVRADREVALNR